MGEDGLPHIDMINANRDQTAGVALIDVRLKDMGDGTNKVMRFRITIGNKLRALECLARHLGIEGFRGDAPRPQEKRHVNESPVKNDPKREEALRWMEEQVREKRRRQAKYASNKQN